MDRPASHDELRARITQLADAVQAEPAHADLRFALATALLQAGDPAGAERQYADAARLRPGWLAPLANRGAALNRLGRFAEGEVVFRQALAVAPDNDVVLCNLAGTLKELGRYAEAVEVSRRATVIAPDQPDGWLNLGATLYGVNRLPEAADAYQRVLALVPGYGLAHYNLGHVLGDLWRTDEAIACFRRAVELTPDYEPAWHALLFYLLYDSQQTGRSIFDAHWRWGARFPATTAAPTRRSPGRIRVGYVSPDFRAHSCASFLEPLFRHHDRAVVDIFVYSMTGRPDAVTAWFRQHADHWREIRGLDDDAIARQVRDDGIDVLVDLAGHTRDQPLGSFARAPAPVQLAWLGYPATSGLRQIGFRITDAQADPPGAADHLHTEQLVRLAGGFLCYGAPEDAPEPGELPVARNGHVTFGSFNHISKITPPVVRAWAAILAATPGSRLVIKGRTLAHEATRERLTAAFADAGIDPARLELLGWIRQAERPIGAYRAIDVALDTFPYNGTTTTFEALWMGVPVVTLRGDHHAARVGTSILTHLGRPEWIADDPDAYVATALRLAADLAALADHRRTLRGALAASSLMDGPGFARRIEAVYCDLVNRTVAASR